MQAGNMMTHAKNMRSNVSSDMFRSLTVGKLGLNEPHSKVAALKHNKI